MKKSLRNNSTQRILEEFTKNAYDTYASKFAETRNGKVHWEEFESILPLLPDHPLKVLDIGCGSGRFFSFLDKNTQIAHYTGIDYSKKLIEEAGIKIGSRENVEWKTEDMVDLEIGENIYDVIVMIASFHHILHSNEQLDLLNKLHTALKPEGVLFMTNWNLLELPLYKKGRMENTSIFEVPLSDGKNTPENRYYYGFDKKELQDLFEKSGFIKSTHVFSEKNNRNIISFASKD